MSTRLGIALQNNPSVGWLVTAVNWFIAAFAWTFQHADLLTKVITLVAALIGLFAGYYTLRIQRRAWKQGFHHRRK